MTIPSEQFQSHEQLEEDGSMATLDVGCGDHPRGDVNVDRYLCENPEVEQYKIRHVDVKAIPNFVRADAHHLPFRDHAFSRVYCFDVIEHVLDPHRLMKELIRVCHGEVEIRAPHRFGRYAKMPFHRNYFNKTWFVRALRGYRAIVDTESFWFPLGPLLTFFQLPDFIRIRILMGDGEVG